MKKRVFIDMDGTLYRFHDHILDESGHVQIEKMYELDFFVKLESFENMKEAINLLHSVDKEEIEIFILSSTDTKEVVHQKNICIDRDFPFIDEEHRLFPKTWESKTDKIPEGIYVGDILIDDYNVNLEQWKDKGGTSIKFVNNINHQGKGRYGGAFSHDKMYRREGISWWEDELPSKEECECAMANLKSVEDTIDIIITHDAPKSIARRYGYDRVDMSQVYATDKEDITAFLEHISHFVNYKQWYCGHYHMDFDDSDSFHFLYQTILKIDM